MAAAQRGAAGYGAQPVYPSAGYPNPGASYNGVVILDARYGTEDAACDAREGVARALGTQMRSAVHVDNSLCGDPASNRRKFLGVRYSCDGNRTIQQQSAWEGETLYLRCR